MKIFLDTSSLFKLYHYEADTKIIEQIFSDFNVTNVYLSEILRSSTFVKSKFKS